MYPTFIIINSFLTFNPFLLPQVPKTFEKLLIRFSSFIKSSISNSLSNKNENYIQEVKSKRQ